MESHFKFVWTFWFSEQHGQYWYEQNGVLRTFSSDSCARPLKNDRTFSLTFVGFSSSVLMKPLPAIALSSLSQTLSEHSTICLSETDPSYS